MFCSDLNRLQTTMFILILKLNIFDHFLFFVVSMKVGIIIPDPNSAECSCKYTCKIFMGKKNVVPFFMMH